MISSTGSVSSRTSSVVDVAIDIPEPGTISPSSESSEPISPTIHSLKLERYINAGEMLPGTIAPPVFEAHINRPSIEQIDQAAQPTKFQRIMAWAAIISFSAAMPALLLPMFAGPIGFILPGILLAAALVCAVKMKMSPGQ